MTTAPNTNPSESFYACTKPYVWATPLHCKTSDMGLQGSHSHCVLYAGLQLRGKGC